MARRTKNHHRKKSFTIPLAVVAGASVGVMNVYKHLFNTGGWDTTRPVGTFNLENGVIEAVRIYTGYSPVDPPQYGYLNPKGFNFTGYMPYGAFPLIGGALVHWGIGKKLGVNRMLAKAGIPFLRI